MFDSSAKQFGNGEKHAQKRGLLAIKEIATLSCAAAQAGGTVAFLDQSLVNIKDL